MIPKPGDIVRFPGLIGRDRGLCLVIGVEPFETGPGARVYVMTTQHKFITADIYEGSLLSADIERINDG